MYALINARIYDYNQYIDCGYIIFSDYIMDIGPMETYIQNENAIEIDCKNQLIVPGFVSGHTHLYSTLARGLSLPFKPQNFLDILKQMWWKVDHYLDLDMIYYSALMGGIDQLKAGTTTLIDHHASFLVKDSLSTIKKALTKDLKIRAVLAFETSDRFDVDQAIKENISIIQEANNHQYAGLFGMHASLSLSDDSLQKISNNLNNAGIHIHVAESLMDEERCFEMYKMSVVERLDKYNLLNENSLLVHCTHISEDEMDIIKKRKSTIAINPTSNLNNAVGISHVKKFLDKGIPVILGNDGLIPSQAFEYLNTYYLSRYKNGSPNAFSLNEIKQIIKYTYQFTNDQLGTSLGIFEIGSEADLLVLPYKPYTRIDKDNVFGHIFFGLYPTFKPEKVFAGGKMLINQYHLVNDYEADYARALQEANKLWQLLEKEGVDLEFKNKF